MTSDVAELAVIVLRLVQYSAASVLMGSALFFVYALPGEGPGSAAALPWPKPLLAIAALLLALGSLLGLIAQTVTLAGSLADALTKDSLAAVASQTSFGPAALVRAGLALVALLWLLPARAGRGLWLGTGLLGAFACATLGWMGHGAATDGSGHTLHLAADVVHALGAAAWLGALAAFAGLVIPVGQAPERLAATAGALRRFSPIGIELVATLAVSGLVNAWFLVGVDVARALHDPYGQLLGLKLALFAGMLALAGLHRQRSVPALAARLSAATMPLDALASLRRSVLAEALLGLAVLALVAWFGTLPPPGAM